MILVEKLLKNIIMDGFLIMCEYVNIELLSWCNNAKCAHKSSKMENPNFFYLELTLRG